MSDEVLASLSVRSKVQMTCMWSSWYHCHPIISSFSEIQNGLWFALWVSAYPGKRPLNYCCGKRAGHHHSWVFEVQNLYLTAVMASVKVQDKGRRHKSVSSNLASPLRELLTCRMGSCSVTCHPAEVTFPPLPQLKLVLNFATPEEHKAELTRVAG